MIAHTIKESWTDPCAPGPSVFFYVPPQLSCEIETLVQQYRMSSCRCFIQEILSSYFGNFGLVNSLQQVLETVKIWRNSDERDSIKVRSKFDKSLFIILRQYRHHLTPRRLHTFTRRRPLQLLSDDDATGPRTLPVFIYVSTKIFSHASHTLRGAT